MRGLKSILNAEKQSAEIHILDDIGPSWAGMVGAKGVAAELKGLGNVKQIDVRVNSLGGSVFEGFAIYNLLKDHPAKVTMHVDGIAASAASTIVMAGDRIMIAKNGFLMIHDPSSIIWGSAEELRKQADLLDGLKQKIADVYASRGKKDAATFSDWMTAETWLDAEQSIEAGLADEIDPNKSAVVNSLSPRMYDFKAAPAMLAALPKCEMPPQTEPPLRKNIEAWKKLGERIGR